MEELSLTSIQINDYLPIHKDDLSESDLEVSYLESFHMREQYLYNYDGFDVNLSSIDLNLFTVYDFGAANSSEITHDVLYRSRTIILSTFAVFFMVGFIGNALVIYTVSRYVTMRRVTYLYLLNLSVADIMYLVVCLPTLSVSYILVDWRFGRLFCKLQNYVMSVSMSVSVLSIVATGLDRYLAVIHPLGARTYRTIKKAVFVISMTWIFSLVVMAPRTVLFEEVSVWHITGTTTLCNRVHTDQILKIDSSLNFVFMYLLPLLVLCICHSRIGQRLWTSKRPGNPLARHGQMRMLLVQHKRRIAKMIFLVTAIFAIGWLPIHIYHLVEDFDKGNILFGKIVDRGTIALFFSFGANSLNPIIYCLFSSNFRKHFLKALRCWKSRINTSINGEDLGYLRNPVTVEIQLENPRPPPVLLPRPASILTDSASYLDSDPIYIGKLTQLSSANFLSLQPLLHEEPNASSSCSETSPNCSSISVTTVAQIEVNSLQPMSGAACGQQLERKPMLTLPSPSTVQFSSPVSGCSSKDLQTSLSTSHTRRAHSLSSSQRPWSYDSYKCDKEMPETLKSLRENVTIPNVSDWSRIDGNYNKRNSPEKTEVHHSLDKRKSPTMTGAKFSDDEVNIYEYNRWQKPFTTTDQNASTASNISSLSQRSAKTSPATKHTLHQTIEGHVKTASAPCIAVHSERLFHSSPNDQSSRKRTIQTESITNLPRSQTVASLHRPTISLWAADSGTTTKQPASISSSTSSSPGFRPKYHSSEQGRSPRKIKYVGCKYKAKKAQNETDPSLPHVD